MTERIRTYICNACGWVYDPEQGDPDGGIAAGTQWEDIPDDWVCPVCGVGKEDFERVETTPDTSVSDDSRQTGSTDPLVIIGSGLSGYSLAKELRKRDRSIPITIITSDSGEVYSKPMLSNALARKHQADDMVQKDAQTMAKELNIEIITGTKVLEIDRDSQQLMLQEKDKTSSLNYDRLVIAAGADPRIFPVEGQDLLDISTVNDLDDYRHWRQKINSGDHILLIGAGLIGCEFANDLLIAGFKVSIIDPAAWPLARLLPKEVGNMLVDALKSKGCSLYLGNTVTRYTIHESGIQAELENGETVKFDHALSAVGLVPRIGLAREAGLEVDAGIIVDRTLRTSDPLIFALGDCAQTEAGLLPFIAPLLAEARMLADTLTGNETMLHLPAMPVVVKTPVLPLIVCPPPAGIDGNWTVEKSNHDAVAVYQTADGTEIGFALSGSKTGLNKTMAKRMPDILPVSELGNNVETVDTAVDVKSYECDVCSYIYDPEAGDPDGGIAPGTAWEDIPDDWVCPVCGAGKEEFTPLS